MSTRWYKVGNYNSTITPVEVTKETPSTVTIYSEFWKREQRSAKHSGYENYFPTFEEARAFLIKKRNEKILYMTKDIARLEEEIVIITGLEEPS